jgi:hypothetical protein
MEKTLQQQYNLIKEGKGSKDDFLKNARRIFPEFITHGNDYNTAVHILRSKSLLSEGVGGVVTAKPNWFKVFGDNIQEAVGVKDTKEYGDQNKFEKIDKDVQKSLDHQFDNSDGKNIDNVYGQSFLIGYLAEMGDPKNSKKTVDELKAIVAKNMNKDINYYAKNGMFGVKGIGLETSKVSKPIKGKYKSSGYGDLKENKIIKPNLEKTQVNESFRKLIRELIKEEINKNNPYALYDKHPKFKEAESAITKILSTAKDWKEVEGTLVNYREVGADDTASREEIYAIFQKKNSINEGYGMSLEDAKAEAERISSEEGVAQHVEETREGSGEYRVSDWFDSDLTVASYINGMEQ